MDWLIIPGVIVTGLGLALLVYCITMVLGAKKQGLADAELRQKLQSASAWNMAGMGVSGIGLMMVVIGVLL